MAQSKHATMIFDGDCGICTASADLVKNHNKRDLLTVEPYQLADLQALSPGLTPELTHQSVYVVYEDGSRVKESKAIAETLKRMSGLWPLAGWLLAFPPITLAAVPVYRWVARNRTQISLRLGLTECAVPSSQSS
ncbi:MAG: DUF393 domain-containing protein [Chloroflexi bacterium]|nr:DUF393 domain-containing protein [Chloroflexota bacterium]